MMWIRRFVGFISSTAFTFCRQFVLCSCFCWNICIFKNFQKCFETACFCSGREVLGLSKNALKVASRQVTIYALSSGRLPSAIAVVRISGISSKIQRCQAQSIFFKVTTLPGHLPFAGSRLASLMKPTVMKIIRLIS